MICRSHLITLTLAAALVVAGAACIEVIEEPTDDSGEFFIPSPPMDNPNAGGDTDDRHDSGDCDDDGDDRPAPTLQCDPASAGPEETCSCMANIVCDQIYFCLTRRELAAKPDYWRPHAACVQELESDCLEDAGDPDYEPADYPRCLSDLEAAQCADFGQFESVSQDFPASCENLRALDTGLGIGI